MAGVASTAVSGALGVSMRVGSDPLRLGIDLQRFAGYTFGLFLGAAGEASGRMK
jgi:hypothetical protein